MDKTKSVKEKYTEWSKRVVEIASETMKRKKNKKYFPTKKLRILQTQKRNLRKKMQKENKNILKMRIKLIDEYIVNEIRRTRAKTAKEVAQRIKTENGINRNNFWEYHKRMNGKNQQQMHNVYDLEGKEKNTKSDIKEAYKQYYAKLLKREEHITRSGLEREQVVNETVKKIIQKTDNSRITTNEEEIKEAIKKLKKKKAMDREQWKSELILNGGEDIEKSMVMMLKEIFEQRFIPEEWNRITIKSIHKKGPMKDLANQRGLFITNIVSKIAERILINRNQKEIQKNISDFQNGGIKNRSVSDNLYILNSVMQMYKNQKLNHYILFTDLNKCFDKLWLEDCIVELVKCGMAIEDAGFLYKMNEHVEAVISTPAGVTEEIHLEVVVKQGTVAGPVLAGVSTDKINRMERYNTTKYYDLEIKDPAFVDDVAGVGMAKTLEDMVRRMTTMEATKKFSYNRKQGKTNYMKICNNPSKSSEDLKLEVKNGTIQAIDEYKYLGDMYSGEGTNMSKLKEKTKKIVYMGNEARRQGSYEKVGRGDMQVRRLIMEAVIIKSILANVEAWVCVSAEELKELDKAHYKLLRTVLEMQKGTPYAGIISETGMWPFSAMLKYKQFMWFHNLVHSDNRRMARRVLLKQIDHPEDETWVTQVKKWAREFDIDLKVDTVNKQKKPTFKKNIKEKINKALHNWLKEESNQKTKLRFLREEEYTEKEYLKKCNFQKCKSIMRLRLNMLDVKANFKNGHEEIMCTACRTHEDTTEHLVQCKIMDKICGKISTENLSKDICRTQWLDKNIIKIEQRLQMKKLIYTV